MRHKCPFPSCSTSKKDCSKHVCQQSYCNEKRYQSNPYCSRHGCTFPSCGNKSSCPLHSCEKSYCDKLKINGFQWCKEHKCHNSSCSNLELECRIHNCQICRFPVEVDNSYCKRHKCPYDQNCNNGYETCADHVCHERSCSGRKIINSEYCIRHKCQYEDCFLEIKCPLHTCQHPYCITYKSLDELYCVDHKCFKCPSLRSSCREHLCVKCERSPIINIQSNLCHNCTCTSYSCREPRVFKSKCRFHAPRCLDCNDIADYFSHEVQQYLYCRKHKCCQICKHKPRNPCKTICNNHHKREQIYPWLYPTRSKPELHSSCWADRTILGKVYYQNCERTAIIKNRVLDVNVNFIANEVLSHTLQYVLNMPTEIFKELEYYLL